MKQDGRIKIYTDVLTTLEESEPEVAPQPQRPAFPIPLMRIVSVRVEFVLSKLEIETTFTLRTARPATGDCCPNLKFVSRCGGFQILHALLASVPFAPVNRLINNPPSCFNPSSVSPRFFAE